MVFLHVGGDVCAFCDLGIWTCLYRTIEIPVLILVQGKGGLWLYAVCFVLQPLKASKLFLQINSEIH